MIFLVNFINHSYQFHWRPKVQCPKCAEIYRQIKEHMFRFLRELLVSNDISVVLEEGGTCLNIAEVMREHGNERTIAQEVIASISNRSILHSFVDITRQEAEELMKKRVINDILQLRGQKRELRDSYIAGASVRVLSENRSSSALLLCADGHFPGVKRHLEETGIPLVSDTIARFEWYISNDEIDRLHLYDHQEGSSNG